MLSILVETSLGDLISKLLFLASIKRQFDFAHLHVRYRDARPYSREVVELVPEIDQFEGLRFFLPAWMRFGLSDGRLWRPLVRTHDNIKTYNRSFVDFVVTDWMLSPRNLHAIPNPAVLRVPPKKADKLCKHLVELGLDPERWFAILHYRSSNYGPKGSTKKFRDSDPESFRAAIDHIIEELDGQAVLLGHPEMAGFKPRPRFIDLSRIRNSFMLQATAVSRARFMIAGPSGPVALGWGFQVPICVVDATDPHGGWGSVEQTILTHTVRTPSGDLLKNRELFEAGLMGLKVLPQKIKRGEPYSIIKNTGAELVEVANYLFERTRGQNSWRQSTPEVHYKRPNCFIWPPQAKENLRFFGEGAS